MGATLPEELLEVTLRQTQLQRLSLFYGAHSYPQTMVTYGPEDKLKTIKVALGDIDHVVIDCRECLSQRHLLHKIYARCATVIASERHPDNIDRLDNINALNSNLRKLLRERQERLVVIIQGADQQRGASVTLFPALARLGDLIPCLSIILTSNAPRPLALHKSGVPYICFPSFTRSEAIQILLRDPPPLLPDPLPVHAGEVKQEKIRAIFNQFATVIYDTLIAPTSNSISKYRQCCRKLWPRFIWPVVAGEKPPGKGTNSDWDFARLLSRGRNLFQAEGEESLQERLVSTSTDPCTFDELIAHKAKEDQARQQAPPSDILLAQTSRSSVKQGPLSTPQLQSSQQQLPPLLKYLPTLLLLSAYLASHTHPKHDIVLFSRLSTASSTNRRKKKYLARSRAGGITKTPTKSPSSKRSTTGDFSDDDNDAPETTATPTKRKSNAGTSTPKKERADRSMRAILSKTSAVARSFTLERLVAILRAIHPDGIGIGRGVADRVYRELGELERLRVVVRANETAARTGKVGDDDVMEEKWKCVVGKEWVVEMGRRWGVGLEGWEVE